MTNPINSSSIAAAQSVLQSIPKGPLKRLAMLIGAAATIPIQQVMQFSRAVDKARDKEPGKAKL